MNPKDAIRKAVERYDQQLADANAERTHAFREGLTQGLQQKDLIEASGYSRETVRRILNPEAVEAAKKRRSEKKEF